MEIILLRHGKPYVELSGYVNAEEFKQLIHSYSQSGVKDLPAKKLKEHFNAHYVVCSDLSRSIESAKKLGLSKVHLSEALFRETEIPHFDKSSLKLSVTVWLVVLRAMWLFGFKKNGESFSKAKNRAKNAAIRLIDLAKENKKVILVGHGLMNRLIAKQLLANEWQERDRSGKRYWESVKYTAL
jgi:broad specificity phosphatase PhoE